MTLRVKCATCGKHGAMQGGMRVGTGKRMLDSAQGDPKQLSGRPRAPVDVLDGEAREHGQPAAHVVAVGVEALGLARVVQHVAEGVRVCARAQVLLRGFPRTTPVRRAAEPPPLQNELPPRR